MRESDLAGDLEKADRRFQNFEQGTKTTRRTWRDGRGKANLARGLEKGNRGERFLTLRPVIRQHGI